MSDTVIVNRSIFEVADLNKLNELHLLPQVADRVYIKMACGCTYTCQIRAVNVDPEQIEKYPTIRVAVFHIGQKREDCCHNSYEPGERGYITANRVHRQYSHMLDQLSQDKNNLLTLVFTEKEWERHIARNSGYIWWKVFYQQVKGPKRK